jgi:hypothetical protein
MFFDLDRIRANVRQAETEDLLDRATVWRADMEEEALDLVNQELRRRGIKSIEVAAHDDARRQKLVLSSDGRPARCCECFRPASVQVRGWHWIWGRIPAFKRPFNYCETHRPTESSG